jgi:adenosine kinase
MNIIVTGSLAFDQIMVYPGAFENHIMADKLHAISVSFTLKKLHKNFGGVWQTLVKMVKTIKLFWEKTELILIILE